MTSPGESSRSLALCTQRPGEDLVERPLSAAAADLSATGTLDAAEHHGVDALLFAHVRAARLDVGPGVLDRLRVRYLQHAHACAVRARVMPDVLDALARSRVRLLVLKGLALAHLAYPDPRLRPMRDVDLLVHPDDIHRAQGILLGGGFAPCGKPLAATYHHLQGLSRTVDGAAVTIELHHELLPRTPFLRPLRYGDLVPASLPIEIGGVPGRAPSREDMLWHAYAHGFAINTLCPGWLRLISLADVVHATEAWVDVLDWDRIRRDYPRMMRALPLVSCVVPWSAKVVDRLGACAAYGEWPVNLVTPSLGWASKFRSDVLWPGEWWFRMRYGIDSLPAWLWYRSIGHPAAFAASAARSLVIKGAGTARDPERAQLLSNPSSQ